MTATELAERQTLVLDLRLQGLSARSIVAAISKKYDMVYSQNQYYTDIKQATSERRVMAETERQDLVQFEVMRLDLLYEKISPAITRGELKAINAAIKIIQTKAALMGLNAPVRTLIETGVEAELRDLLTIVRSVLSDEDYRKVLTAVSKAR